MLDKIRWLWKYYRRHRYVLTVLLVLTPVQTLYQVTIPQLFGFTIDYVESNTVPDAFLAMYTFEATCMIQVRAQAGGGELADGIGHLDFIGRAKGLGVFVFRAQQFVIFLVNHALLLAVA